MYDKTQAYLGTMAGNLLYLGGNGIYRRCTYDADSRTMLYMQDSSVGYPPNTAPPSSAKDGWQFVDLIPCKSEVRLLGMGGTYGFPGASAGAGYDETAAQAANPLFSGTTVAQNGASTIGARGNNSYLPAGAPTQDNGGASNWETANWATGSPEAWRPMNATVLGQSANSDLLYFPASGGGLVFSVGSITFGGSLYIDTDLQRLVKNVLTRCGV